MHEKLTVNIERDQDWFIAWCPEMPGANGQGRTFEESLESFVEAVKLIFEDREKNSPHKVDQRVRCSVLPTVQNGADEF